MNGPAAPANWYPDPNQPAMLRFWDGAQWTHHTAPAMAPSYAMPQATPSAPDLGPSHGLHYVLPVGRSPQAVAAPYVGLVAVLVCWVPVLGLAAAGGATWLGVAALKRARTGGHGSGRAIVALVFAAFAAVANLNATYNLAFGG